MTPGDGTTDARPADDDPRVIAALKEYEAALLAGRRPDRHAFLARHADVADALREGLDALEFVQRAGAPLRSSSGTPPTTAVAAVPPPERLGDFRLLQRLGQGGMGVVFEAVQESLGRRVALKTLPASAALLPAERERFRREAQAAAKLHHTNIVPVFGVGEHDGVPYYAMQYIDGRGLDAVLAELRQPSGAALGLPAHADPAFFRSAARLWAQAADGLAYAHGQGVLHRDVKPSNLLLDAQGTVWLADFGLARLEGAPDLTKPGDVVGTLRYLAPERFQGRSDARSDVYSLGVTLYELLTLRPAFADGDRYRLGMKIVAGALTPPRRLEPRIPRDLETVLLKAVERDPARRYATAGELADDLRRFLEDRPVKARRPTALEGAARWARRHRALVLTAAAAAAVAVAVAVTALTAAYFRVRAALDHETGLTGELNTALAELREEQRRTALALGREQQHSYFRAVALAERELEENDVDRADRLLGECAARLRGWEWHYLRRQCHAELRTLRGHTAPVLAVTFSPDGRTVASAGADGTVRLWDRESGRERLTLRETGPVVPAVAFRPDGRLLATGCKREVHLWDPATGERVRTLPGRGRDVWAVAFSPDGKHLATGGLSAKGIPDPSQLARSRGEVTVWDLATGKELRSVRAVGAVHAVTYSPDGRQLAYASDPFGDDAGAVLMAPADGLAARRIPGHPGGARAVAFSPDGRLLAEANLDGTVKAWDAAARKPRGTFRGHSKEVVGVAFSPDGRYLASAGFDHTVRLWDVAAGPGARLLQAATVNFRALAFAPDGRRLVGVTMDRAVNAWDVADGRRVTSLPAAGRVGPVALGGDGRFFAAVPEADPRLTVWDAATNRPVFTAPAPRGRLAPVALSADGRFLAAPGEGRAVRVWDVPAGREVTTLRGHTRAVQILALSPDGKRLASAAYAPSRDGQAPTELFVWDTATGQRLGDLASPPTECVALAFSPGGESLAAVGRPGPIKAWDVGTGRALFTVVRQSYEVRSLAYSPDGRRLATGGPSIANAGEVKLWDAATGEELLGLRGHLYQVMAVAFSPDGRLLATVDIGNQVRVWDATPLGPP